ncbi:MAG TPA: MFS transporter [Candidatus Saccharimonadales bacterium]|nr:MFS transporter [Candidatus Saccharimonadales bacterium]
MKTSTFSALSERAFLYLWIGEIFTQIPTHLFNFFLVLLVFKITHSNTAVSGVVLSFTVPAILFGSIAGAYVDRWDKKKVIIITNIARAILMIILIFFLNNIFMIYIVSLAVSVLVQFFIPAETPMVPLVVGEKKLLSANALFGMAIFASILVAYVLSGPVIILLKPTGTLILLAAMLFTGAGFISLIDIKSKITIKSVVKKAEIFKDIKHVFLLMSKTKQISRSLFLLAMSQILILVVATIAPGYASQILKIQIEDFPLLFAAPAALGMVLGATLIIKIFHSHVKEKLITFGIFVSGVAMMLLPYGSKVASRGFVMALNVYLPHIVEINILHIMVFLAFVLGVANSFVFVPANTILQEKTTDEVRGKLYGILNSVIGALSLLPIIIVGGLSDIVGVGVVITGIGISILLVGFVWAFRILK